MLKNFGYAGIYRDKDISINVLFESPVDHGVDIDKLVFSVRISARHGELGILLPNEFTFYIMDEANRLYNVENVTYSESYVDEVIETDASLPVLKSLIVTDFRHEFLYQDLRVAFAYEPLDRIEIIRLMH